MRRYEVELAWAGGVPQRVPREVLRYDADGARGLGSRVCTAGELRMTWPIPTHSRGRTATSLLCALVLAAAPIAGCASASCDSEAAQASTLLDPKRSEEVRAKCEKRLVDLRRHLAQQEEERRTTDSRDTFVNQTHGPTGGPP